MPVRDVSAMSRCRPIVPVRDSLATRVCQFRGVRFISSRGSHQALNCACPKSQSTADAKKCACPRSLAKRRNLCLSAKPPQHGEKYSLCFCHVFTVNSDDFCNASTETLPRSSTFFQSERFFLDMNSAPRDRPCSSWLVGASVGCCVFWNDSRVLAISMLNALGPWIRTL